MTRAQEYTVAELAELAGATVRGDGNRRITGVAALADATGDCIAYCEGGRFVEMLAATHAGAVLVREEDADACPATALVVDRPYYAFAAVAMRLHPLPRLAAPGVDDTAIVATTARLGSQVAVGPYVVIGEHAVIGDNTQIGAGSYIGDDVHVGRDGYIASGVTLTGGTRAGERLVLQPGVVVGSDGFGFAPGPEGWRKVPQVGRAVIGHDVEIGANTTIDRGGMQDTVIGDNVKIDNLVHIAHNVHIGEGTVIAGCAAIAGSTRIGRGCMIGGVVGVADHVEVADGVTLMGMTGVTGNIRDSGVYASVLPARPVREWRRNTVRFTQLEDLFRRIKSLEQKLDDADEK